MRDTPGPVVTPSSDADIFIAFPCSELPCLIRGLSKTHEGAERGLREGELLMETTSPLLVAAWVPPHQPR